LVEDRKEERILRGDQSERHPTPPGF
jgi:hypothetical protein